MKILNKNSKERKKIQYNQIKVCVQSRPTTKISRNKNTGGGRKIQTQTYDRSCKQPPLENRPNAPTTISRLYNL